MKPSPLQLRLTALLPATGFVATLCFLLAIPKRTIATDISYSNIVVDQPLLDRSLDYQPDGEDLYEPDFSLFDDRNLHTRAPEGVYVLTNNVPMRAGLEPGGIGYFAFEFAGVSPRALAKDLFSRAISSLENREPNDGTDSPLPQTGEPGDQNPANELHERQTTSRKVFISVNTCIQPQPVALRGSQVAPPQLTLYVSTSQEIQYPGPGGPSSVQNKSFTEGAVMLSVNSVGPVYISVVAPNVTSDLSGSYNFEVGVSVEEWYHSFDADSTDDLLWVDSDSSSVLLFSPNITTPTNSTVDDNDDDTIANSNPDDLPYRIFAESLDSGRLNGVRYSYCGLQNYAEIAAVKNGRTNTYASIKTGMTRRGPGGSLRQRFFFWGLDSRTAYTAIPVAVKVGQGLTKRQAGGAQRGGGGRVLPGTQFETKIGDNCKVITDLQFCNETEYAVPANENNLNITQLASFYDDYAKKMYGFFETALMQVPCDAPTTQKYSLVRSCDDCKVAYKNWLCSVAIPRCEDFTSDNQFGHIRNVEQPFPNGTLLSNETIQSFRDQGPAFLASRNAIIDDEVKPGPYKEILPCDDLCYQLVQSCPAALGFACPRPNNPYFNSSYGWRQGDSLSCNYPGSAHFPSTAAPRLSVPAVLIGSVVLAALLL